MKKLKFVFWLIFVGFFALLVYQNLEYFSAKNSLQINLSIYQRSTPELANGVIIAGFVGIAVFIMLIFYFSSRYSVYRANKTIKELRKATDDRTSDIDGLKAELESLRQGSFSTKKPDEVREESEDETAAVDAPAAQSPQS
jgi:uncharacterized membrane protein YciS (DUF1049 family)